MGPLILLVEDDFLIAEQIRYALEDAGFEVVGPAESADQAMALLQGRWPEVAVLDIRIKGEADGVELAGRLKATAPLGVVFLTGSGEPETRRRAMAVGDAFLMKPFTEDSLIGHIRALLDRPGSDLEAVSGSEDPGGQRQAEA